MRQQDNHISIKSSVYIKPEYIISHSIIEDLNINDEVISNNNKCINTFVPHREKHECKSVYNVMECKNSTNKLFECK